MEYDVFISCKSEDYIYAEEIYNFLKENGFNVFLANKELRQMGDSEYRKAISQALKSTYQLIQMMSVPPGMLLLYLLLIILNQKSLLKNLPTYEVPHLGLIEIIP